MIFFLPKASSATFLHIFHSNFEKLGVCWGKFLKMEVEYSPLWTNLASKWNASACNVPNMFPQCNFVHRFVLVWFFSEGFFWKFVLLKIIVTTVLLVMLSYGKKCKRLSKTMHRVALQIPWHSKKFIGGGEFFWGEAKILLGEVKNCPLQQKKSVQPLKVIFLQLHFCILSIFLQDIFWGALLHTPPPDPWLDHQTQISQRPLIELGREYAVERQLLKIGGGTQLFDPELAAKSPNIGSSFRLWRFLQQSATFVFRGDVLYLGRCVSQETF